MTEKRTTRTERITVDNAFSVAIPARHTYSSTAEHILVITDNSDYTAEPRTLKITKNKPNSEYFTPGVLLSRLNSVRDDKGAEITIGVSSSSGGSSRNVLSGGAHHAAKVVVDRGDIKAGYTTFNVAGQTMYSVLIVTRQATYLGASNITDADLSRWLEVLLRSVDLVSSKSAPVSNSSRFKPSGAPTKPKKSAEAEYCAAKKHHDEWEEECRKIEPLQKKYVDEKVAEEAKERKEEVIRECDEKIADLQKQLSANRQEFADLTIQLSELHFFRFGKKAELRERLAVLDSQCTDLKEKVFQQEKQKKNADSEAKWRVKHTDQYKKEAQALYPLPEEPKVPRMPQCMRDAFANEFSPRNTDRQRENYGLMHQILDYMDYDVLYCAEDLYINLFNYDECLTRVRIECLMEQLARGGELVMIKKGYDKYFSR